jgi:DNA-binding SARP family transcriptional activator
MPALEFRLLGALEVSRDGAPVAIEGPRARALLAVLLLRANTPVTSAQLIDDLWPDQLPASPANALQVQISRLRAALAPDGTGMILRHGAGYMLVLGPAQMDLLEFERGWDAARRAVAAGDPRTAAALLRAALDLWRGEPLAEFAGEHFADADAHRLAEMRLAALGDRIDADLSLGGHRELVGELNALVRRYPLNERTLSQLMLALYRCGRQVDALAACADARARFADNYGLSLGPDVQRLEREILRQEPDLAAPATGAPAAPRRSVLISAGSADAIDALAAIAAPLAAEGSGCELLVVRTVEGSSESLDGASAEGAVLLRRLERSRIAGRIATFTSDLPADDLIRLVDEQQAALMLLELGAPPERLQRLLESATCDVGLLAGQGRSRPRARSPVLVAFGGGGHDWAALELACWVAKSVSVPVWMVGVNRRRGHHPDASRTLAAASLAVQRWYGIVPEPRIVPPGVDRMVELSGEARLFVLGLADDWPRKGIGSLRGQLADRAACPVALVRRGRRPGGLAPAQSVTRFTWSLADDPDAHSR